MILWIMKIKHNLLQLNERTEGHHTDYDNRLPDLINTL